MENVLLTRSEDENVKLAQYIKNIGYKAKLLPIVKYFSVKNIDFSQYRKYTNVIVTSKFAAIIVSKQIRFHINCYVVGEASASILQESHFAHVLKVFTNVEALRQEVNISNDYIYYCGNMITKELDGAKKVVVYRTKYRSIFVKKNLHDIKSSHYILIYSKQASKTFFSLCKKYNVLDYLNNLTMIGISYNCIKIFKNYASELLYPPIPSQKSLLMILKEIKNNEE